MTCSNQRLHLTLAIFKPDLVLWLYCIEHDCALLLKSNFITMKSKSRSKVEECKMDTNCHPKAMRKSCQTIA